MGKPLVIVALVLGVIFLILAGYYWITPASALPGFLPGYEAGVEAHHVKHSIASLVIAVVLFCLAWFQSKPAKVA